MSVAHDADSNANSGATTVASLTWSHTVTGSNTLLVVGIAYTGASVTISTITYAGANPTGSTTRLQDGSGAYQSQLFWWVNPTTGANNVVVTPSGVASIFGGGASFTGVDQTKPVTTAETRTSTGSSFGTVTQYLTPQIDNEMLFCLIGLANSTSTITGVAPATEAFNQFDATASRTAGGEWFLASSAFNASPMQWTISGAANRNYSLQAISILPSGGTKVAKNVIISRLRPHPFSPGLAR